MSTAELLDHIRFEALSRILRDQDGTKAALTFGEDQLVDLFDILKAVIDLRDPRLIDPLLDEWHAGKIAQGNPSISESFESIFHSIINISQARLSVEQSQQLISVLLPIYFHANQYLHQQEIQLTIELFSQEQSSLEQLEKSKSDFISIAAHELKTPLTLMEGYSSMLRELLEQKKIYDEHIFLLVDGMDSGSRRLREIISDMIDVSLIDNELLSLTFQPTWLYKVINRVKEYYNEAAQSRKIFIGVTRFIGDDILNFFDGERIFQAISNVVSNGIKYTPDGGRISIDGRRFEDFVEIRIIDNGIGIDPQDQIKIFDKFQAVGEVALHSSGKFKFKGGGPGLGLPIAKGIIEAHGGRIWVESDGYDEKTCPGSTFHLLLPIRERPPDYTSADLYEPLFIRKPNSNSK
jgi:signal transduction histidine kinase